MRTMVVSTLLFWSAISPPSQLGAQVAIACQPGASPQYGSGWCEFTNAVDLKKGERIRLAVGGAAQRVIVRLLPKGADPTTTVGVIPTVMTVPTTRFLEITLPYDAPLTIQISVHGGASPWNQYPLGPNNGAATISGMERLSSPQTRPKP